LNTGKKNLPKKHQHIQKNNIFEKKQKKQKENIKGFKMLIIRKIIRRKNSFKRKLQLSFEVFNLCNLMIVKEFTCVQKQNFFYILFFKTITVLLLLNFIVNYFTCKYLINMVIQ